MKVQLGIWDKLTRVVIFLLFLAGLLSVAVWYLPLIRQNQRLREAILVLDNKIRHEDEVSRELKDACDALRSDPKAIERLARERLGYAKPSEIVIRFESPAVRNQRP